MENWISELATEVELRKHKGSEITKRLDEAFDNIISEINTCIEKVNSEIYKGESIIELHTPSDYHLKVISHNSGIESYLQFSFETLELQLISPGDSYFFRAFIDDKDGVSFSNSPKVIQPEELSRLLIEPIIKSEFHLIR